MTFERTLSRDRDGNELVSIRDIGTLRVLRGGEGRPVNLERYYGPDPQPLPPSELERLHDAAMRRTGGDKERAEKLVLAYLRGRNEAEQRRTE